VTGIIPVLMIVVMSAGPVAGARDLVLISGAGRSDARAVEALGAVVNAASDQGLVAEADADQQARLKKLGFVVRVVTPDITDRYAKNALSEATDGRYLTYEEFRDTMITIAQNNPAICKLETLGRSYNNNLLLALKFSDNPQIHENEPAVHFEGNIHGDEKIGWAVAFEMVKYLCQNYGTDTLVTRLINTREIWLHPMYNPDGYISGDRTNGNSVDLNRNWGWMWGNEAQPGASPFSEPENRALLSHIWRHPFAIFVSFHAGTEFISYPWSYSPDTAPEKPLLNFLSQRYSVPNGYEYGQGYQGMYPINGSTKDFDYGQGMMGWSIEVNMQKTPPASEIAPTFERNRTAMLEFFHRAGQGIQGVVTDASTARPVHCQVWVGPANWPSYNDTCLGDFHRFCLPGTYTVTFRAPAYLDTTITDVVVPNSGDSSVTVSVQMRPDDAAPLFAYRLVYSYYVNEMSNHTYPVRALGARDNAAYQLDNGKYICLDMDKPVRNGDGNDLTVYRSSGSGTATVQGANSWQGPWTSIGTANSAQTSFDLGSVGLDSVRYVRLTASGTFNLDAVEGVSFTGIAASRTPLTGRPELTLGRNPSRGTVRFSLSRPPAPGTRLAILDAAGRLIRSLPAPGCVVIFDARALPAGVYFVRLEPSGAPPMQFTIAR